MGSLADAAASPADVAIVKSQATPNPAVPGQAVTWTITVTNNGPSDATGVQTADTVPAAVAGLAVVDMVKGMDRTVEIAHVRLLEKQGGRSGTWTRPED